jgi:hypothetical protein
MDDEARTTLPEERSRKEANSTLKGAESGK